MKLELFVVGKQKSIIMQMRVVAALCAEEFVAHVRNNGRANTTYAHTYIHTYTHTHTAGAHVDDGHCNTAYAHTYMHIYIHTNIHTQTQLAPMSMTDIATLQHKYT